MRSTVRLDGDIAMTTLLSILIKFINFLVKFAIDKLIVANVAR